MLLLTWSGSERIFVVSFDCCDKSPENVWHRPGWNPVCVGVQDQRKTFGQSWLTGKVDAGFSLLFSLQIVREWQFCVLLLHFVHHCAIPTKIIVLFEIRKHPSGHGKCFQDKGENLLALPKDFFCLLHVEGTAHSSVSRASPKNVCARNPPTFPQALLDHWHFILFNWRDIGDVVARKLRVPQDLE